MDSHTTLIVGANTSVLLVYKHLVVPQPVMQKTRQHLLPDQYSKLLPRQHLRLKMRLMRNQHLQRHQARIGFAGLGQYDFLTGVRLLQQTRQVGLGFVNIDGDGHREILTKSED